MFIISFKSHKKPSRALFLFLSHKPPSARLVLPWIEDVEVGEEAGDSVMWTCQVKGFPAGRAESHLGRCGQKTNEPAIGWRGLWSRA